MPTGEDKTGTNKPALAALAEGRRRKPLFPHLAGIVSEVSMLVVECLCMNMERLLSLRSVY